MTQKHSGRMRRLVAAGLLPERAGQPVKALGHVSLADLMLLDGSSALMDEWTSGVRAQWAGRAPPPPRAAATAGRGWTGTAPRVHLRRLDHPGSDRRGKPGRAGGPDQAVRRTGQAPPGRGPRRRRRDPAQDMPAEEALEQAIIGKAVDLLSGPGGLA